MAPIEYEGLLNCPKSVYIFTFHQFTNIPILSSNSHKHEQNNLPFIFLEVFTLQFQLNKATLRYHKLIYFF